IVCGVPDVDFGAQTLKPNHSRRTAQVRPADLEVKVDEHLGNARHAGTANAHQVNIAGAMHKADGPTLAYHAATSRQARATAAALSRIDSERALPAICSSVFLSMAASFSASQSASKSRSRTSQARSEERRVGKKCESRTRHTLGSETTPTR